MNRKSVEKRFIPSFEAFEEGSLRPTMSADRKARPGPPRFPYSSESSFQIPRYPRNPRLTSSCGLRLENLSSGHSLISFRSFPMTAPKKQRNKSSTLGQRTEKSNTQPVLHDQELGQIRQQAEAIANLSEGILITEGSDWLNSRIVFVNDGACRMTGYTAKELAGQQRSILHGDGTDPEILNRIQREVAEGKASHAELIFYRKDGAPYHADLSVTPLGNSVAAGSRFISIHRDITERKKA